jgi:hypothetical protein
MTMPGRQESHNETDMKAAFSVGGLMDLPNLRKRVRALEAIAFRTSANKDCTCRSGRKTYYHTAADLEQIMSVRCSAHGFRDQGDLLWVPPGTPILPEDRHLCSCPSCPTRDWLAGNREPLTKQEQENECGSWEPELTARRREKLRIDQAREEALLQTYFRMKRRHHAELQR